MLYLGTGDGGGGGDPNGNGQNQNTLLGKLLRLDVRTLPYTIPGTNPFAGMASRRGEIWAYGLRNPWRFAFDRGTTPATLYVADVGQNRYEEVNAVASGAAGVNYGWVVMEGQHCYPSGETCNRTGLTLPVLEYSHASGGCSITGGYVYRGAAIPELAGQYFYSDYCSGFLASMSGGTGPGVTSRTWSVADVGNVLSFGEDAAGELYVLSTNGTVYRIAKQ
jgi:glucose/arabinose dehydrogenase